MPLIDYQPYKEFPEVKGVFLGGCVERGDGSSFRRIAHAHTAGEYKGIICVRSPKRLWHMDGPPIPSLTMVHELAHIVSGCGHTDLFRKAYKELSKKFWGFEIPDSWDRTLVKKARHVHTWVFIRTTPDGKADRCSACDMHRFIYKAFSQKEAV